MNYLILKKQSGVGLIEVLIATVVVALGLLAVASMQGDFIVSSGDSKTRAEALTLAEKKIEMLRNNIVLDNGSDGGYSFIPTNATADSGTAVTEDPITGTNATFTRSWVIDQGGTADRKKISVLVTWDSNGNGAVDDDEKVNVVTEMAFSNPAKSALYAGTGGGGAGGTAVPSPRQNASEDINSASEDVIGTGLAITDLVTSTTGSAGVDQQIQVDPETGVALILSQVASESHFYTATHSDYPAKIDEGVIAVFLCDDLNSTCSHIQNHFGGVVHRVKGTVYSSSGQSLTSRFIAWTSSASHVCYNGSVDTSGSIPERPYECVYAGNCDKAASGIRTASSGGLPNAVAEGCFADNVVSNEQIIARNVGPGGEYGDIGLLGLGASGGGIEQVCFLENTVAEDTILVTAGSGKPLNENYLYSATKRLYVTRTLQRNTAANPNINDHKNEGINRSYTNHNFFIADRGSGPQTKKECREQVDKEVAPREISRVLNEGTDNIILPELAYAGGTGIAHTLTGEVTGSSATKLRLFIPEIGACYLNNNLEDPGTAATAYACVIGSTASSAEIVGASNEHNTLDPSIFASCTKQTDNTPDCNWLSNFTTTFNDGGASDGSCSTPWGASMTDGETDIPAYATSACNTPETLTCTSGTLNDFNSLAIYETVDLCITARDNTSCTLPWGVSIDHGATEVGHVDSSVVYPGPCPMPPELTCNNGSLSADGLTEAEINNLNQSCTVDAGCTVPNIVGMATNNATTQTAVDTAITAAGFVVGTKTLSSENPREVHSQVQVSGTVKACNTAIDYTLND